MLDENRGSILEIIRQQVGGQIENRESSIAYRAGAWIQHQSREPTTSTRHIEYHGDVMAKKPRKKKKMSGRPPLTGPAKKDTKYSPGEIAMAVLGAAILIMVAGIIITSLLG